MGVEGVSKADVEENYFNSDDIKIPSFQINHCTLKPGLYYRGTKCNISTFDLRFVKPNTQFIPVEAIHTIEHLFATWLKLHSTISSFVISFNPGGCQTMFYLELFAKENIDDAAVIILNCIRWCLKQNKVPGATEEKCGNYKSHNLNEAKKWLKEYINILKEQYLLD